MASPSKIRVMISSRCNDSFPVGAKSTLSDLRRELKAEIEAQQIAGRKSFEVWINEEVDPQGGIWDSWDVCIQAVKECDVLIVLSNGDAGWAQESGEIGICHAEMMTGLSVAPAKVRLIQLDAKAKAGGSAVARNQRFQDEISRQSQFRGGVVATIDDAKKRVSDALHDAVIKLMQAGVRDASRGKFHSGAALDWSRMDFGNRQAEMVRVLRGAMLERAGSIEESGRVFIRLDDHLVLAEAHAIPAAMSVGPAKELVGQPFLKDHSLAAHIKRRRGGPIHVIACHKTATEGQASKLLGFPDATFVTGPFGVFVADPIQKVQLALINNCRDEATTRHGLQRFLEWSAQTGEDALIASRAKARTRIVAAIAKEMES